MTEFLPEMRQQLATDRSKQWIAEQVEKSDATMEDTRAPLHGASSTASGSGRTNEEKEAGKLTSGNRDSIAVDVNIELEEAPGDKPGLRNRVSLAEGRNRAWKCRHPLLLLVFPRAH